MEIELIECTDGTWIVMLGEKVIARRLTKGDAEDYRDAMLRGDC